MSKSILLSIKPEYVAKILNGEKTIEIRKKFPKDYVGWVYIYCTKGKSLSVNMKMFFEGNDCIRNGKVVARFWCDKVERFYNAGQWAGEEPDDIMNIMCSNACISRDDLDDYCEGRYFYAIHISKLEVFDKPKKLWVFYKINKKIITCEGNYWKTLITKAPSNYCYIGDEE